MVGKNFENPWGIKLKSGKTRSITSLLDAAVFPGSQGGPLEHVIAAKAIAFGEAQTSEFKNYCGRVIENAAVMASEMINRGYSIISAGTDNHSMLIDLRSKNVTGKEAENGLGKADITVNKNMVPFDTQSPFITSGIRLGTAAITTRGVNKEEIKEIVELIDQAIINHENDSKLNQIRIQVNNLMSNKPLFKW